LKERNHGNLAFQASCENVALADMPSLLILEQSNISQINTFVKANIYSLCSLF
jgi:hypothetical protein